MAVCTVALTGGLASGKSAVARQLVSLGAHVRDADAVVHELYRSGEPGARRVAELFGAQVLDATGAVDRNRLSHIVQAQAGALERLQDAVHPLVRERISSWLDELAHGCEGPTVAVVEAALLIEGGWYHAYDVLVVVWCRRFQQLERAIARGMPRRRAEHLVAAQLDLDAKRELADVVVDNSGGLADLADRTAMAWKTITSLCAGRHGGGSGPTR